MSLPMIEAKYLARACGAAQFEESGNNNMQIAIPFEILDEEFSGETITWFHTMHDVPDKKGKTGKDRAVEALVYMGFQGDDMTALMDISDDEARALLPDAVELVVAPDEHEGKTRLKVKWVNRAGAGRAGFKKPLTKDGMRAFAAQMRGALKNARGGSAQRPAQQSTSSAARPSYGNSQRATQPHPNAPGGAYGADAPNDDIPF
jgi:hypothetical protein